MSSLLVCSVPFQISSGVPVCPAPGVLSSVDLSVVSGVGSTVDPVQAVEAFGSGFIVAGPLFVIVLLARVVIAPLFRKR